MKKTFKRLGAMFLAMVMAVSVLCTGAFADDGDENTGASGTGNTSTGHTISVKAGDSHVYLVYQIFTGDYSKKENEDATLSNIKWGQNGKAKSNDESVVVGTLVSSSVLDDIADANKKTTDAEKLKIITPYANTTGTTVGTAATEAYAEVSTDKPANNVPDGYYLIKDKSVESNKNEAATTYLVKVIGTDLEIERKAPVPTVDKTVNNKKADTTDIGKNVSFTLKGTLPDNYDVYTSYKYIFHDTLSKGLTLPVNDNEITGLTVTVYPSKDQMSESDGKVLKKVSEPTDSSTDTSGYYVTYSTDAESGETSLTVAFADLKGVKKDTNDNDVTITKDSVIVVSYSATLNENAVLGSKGNTNTVQLEYSNNPDSDTTGETEGNVVKVYTFQLNILKAKDDNGTPLSGAKFVLAKEKIDNFDSSKVNDNTYKDKLIPVTAYTASNVTDSTYYNYVVGGSAYEMEVSSEGKLNIKGLNEGTYYLYETEAPAGYNKLTEPVEIKITAGKTNEVVNGSVSATLTGAATGNIDNKTDGILATVKVVNKQGSNLPSTGGMGTKLFYTIGGLLMAGAAIVLVIKKRRSTAE